jgi:membrane protease YdiL (CAAX protease family)
LVVGFLSIGISGPIVEEIIFRGLLLEKSHEIQRSKSMRYFLDFVVCLFFALLHIPISFIAPLILAATFIYVRRRTGSLLPSIFMHASWNSSILIAMQASL